MNLFRALLHCVVLYPTAIAKEEQSTLVGPTDNFEQSKEKNYDFPIFLSGVGIGVSVLGLGIWVFSLSLLSSTHERDRLLY